MHDCLELVEGTPEMELWEVSFSTLDNEDNATFVVSATKEDAEKRIEDLFDDYRGRRL